MVNGKPHADTIWLEITNFCNQKCTFCPDMHREDARSWLPLDRIKALLDEIAATISVGSMQLNAYGEPLLHPNIAEILAYIREKRLAFPTFFTTHGMTLVPKKLAQLSNNYPSGIAVSLHNDSQESYAMTRSAKIGDYDTLVERLTALATQMVTERAPAHLRLYQMVSNGTEDMRVDPHVRSAFAPNVARFTEHLRKWEAIGAGIAAAAPASAQAEAIVNDDMRIARSFLEANHDDGIHLPILEWTDVHGGRQQAFFSPRPLGTYANLLLEYHPDWSVGRTVLNTEKCGFVAAPALAIFATGRLGICCLDLNSTATFTSLDDHASLADAMTSPAAAHMFAQVSNGVATSRGCQICLSSDTRLCSR
nr:radical SAM protein [Sphingomonas sp. CROZ-RG-20F-R02-07]